MSEPETDAVGLRLLSLDGGGIRGLSTLLILETIMHRIKTEEDLEQLPRPCDYFDLIGGTSTGGIIALMLGRLRMSVKEAIECYDNLAGKVFSELKRGGDGKYKASMLEEVVKAIVKERTGDSEASLLDDGALGGICKTFVCAMNAHNMNARIPVLFRTYVSPKESSIPCTVWQAARATSAAPTFFKRIFIGPDARPEPFVDGGVGRNNPTAQVLGEAELMFPDRNIACVISIGTGQPGTIDIPNPSFFERNVVPVGVIKAMVDMATDCEETAQQMEKRFENWPTTYFRFNVEQGLQKVKLGDWERMSEVAAHTRNYMKMHEVDQRLAIAVKAIRERQGGIKTSTLNKIPNRRLTIHAEIDISPSYIPEKPLYFFGRDEEHADIIQALLNSESVIIPGGGGMGKTTLALAVLHDQRIIGSEQFHSRIYFIDCSTITTLEGLYGQLAVDLHIPKAQRNSHLPETLLQTFRIIGATIMCLDNFETLWDVSEARSNIQTMLSRFHAIPTLALLLTMRGIHRPANLRWSKASPHSLSRLSEDASTSIFREESELPEVDEYAKRLIEAADGMPLTITLLARLAQIETPKATWARWMANGTSIVNQGPGRTMNLDTSIELSLSSPRLKDDASAAQTLGILAFLPGGLEHPSEITHDLQSALPDDVDLPTALYTLVTVGLAYIDATKRHRYRVLSPISNYAVKCQMTGPSAQSGLINYYTTFILDRSLDTALESDSTLHTIVPLELANICSVLELGIIQNSHANDFDDRHIHALLAHMRWELFLGTPSLALVQKALLMLPLPPDLQGYCHAAIGDVHSYQDRLADAEQSLSRAVELHQQAQDISGEADDLQRLGALYLRQNILGEANDHQSFRAVYLHQDRLAEAEQSLSRALELHQQAQDVLGEANDRRELGDLYLWQDRLAEAEQSLSLALELHQQAQHIFGEANDYESLGTLYLRQDRLADAESSLIRALELYHQAHNVLGQANGHRRLGDLYLRQGRLAEAEQSLSRALELHQQAQSALGEANDHQSLGALYMRQDRLVEAEQSLSWALELHQQTQDVVGEANDRRELGDLYLRQGRPAEAEQSLGRALELHQQAQDTLGEANVHGRLGALYMRQNRLVEAEQSLSQALELHQQAQNVLGEANDHQSLGVLYVLQDRLADAERMLIRALEMHQSEAHSVLGQANEHLHLGDLYLHQARFADAEQSLSRALELHQQAQNVFGEAYDYQSLGDLYLHQDRLAEAEQSLGQALEMHERINAHSDAMKDRTLLARVHERQQQSRNI